MGEKGSSRVRSVKRRLNVRPTRQGPVGGGMFMEEIVGRIGRRRKREEKVERGMCICRNLFWWSDGGGEGK